MADNSTFVKMDVFYEEDQVTISSGSIHTMDERVIMMGEDFQLIPHQSTIEAVGYSEDGFMVMIGRVSLSTESQLNFDIIKTDEKQERRNSLKVKVHMKIKLLRAYSLGKSGRTYSLNETIQIRDLSLGGIAFYSNSILFKKQKVRIDLSELKAGFIAQAQVLRKERGSFRGGYRFKYGCCFQNVKGEEERVLCEFVFKTQLENHRKLMRLQEESN